MRNILAYYSLIRAFFTKILVTTMAFEDILTTFA